MQVRHGVPLGPPVQPRGCAWQARSKGRFVPRQRSRQAGEIRCPLALEMEYRTKELTVSRPCPLTHSRAACAGGDCAEAVATYWCCTCERGLEGRCFSVQQITKKTDDDRRCSKCITGQEFPRRFDCDNEDEVRPARVGNGSVTMRRDTAPAFHLASHDGSADPPPVLIQPFAAPVLIQPFAAPVLHGKGDALGLISKSAQRKEGEVAKRKADEEEGRRRRMEEEAQEKRAEAAAAKKAAAEVAARKKSQEVASAARKKAGEEEARRKEADEVRKKAAAEKRAAAERAATVAVALRGRSGAHGLLSKAGAALLASSEPPSIPVRLAVVTPGP